MLWPRALEALSLAARGHTRTSAAHEMGLSRHTVANLHRHVFDRLGVSTTVEAVAILDDHLPGWRPTTSRPHALGQPSDPV